MVALWGTVGLINHEQFALLAHATTPPTIRSHVSFMDFGPHIGRFDSRPPQAALGALAEAVDPLALFVASVPFVLPGNPKEVDVGHVTGTGWKTYRAVRAPRVLEFEGWHASPVGGCEFERWGPASKAVTPAAFEAHRAKWQSAIAA